MTQRHRFLPFRSDASFKKCQERFGGVAACNRNQDDLEVHWSDIDHPFVGGGDECTWRLQGAEPFQLCGVPRASRVHLGGWEKGLVRPPDEDAVAPAAAPPPRPMWSIMAARIAGNDEGEVLAGPWPVRLYWVRDGRVPTEFLGGLNAAFEIGDEFSVATERAEGGRWILLAWGRYTGLSRDVIADEMAAEFDQ